MKMNDFEILRRIADGQGTSADKERLQQLCEQYGVRIKNKRCKSCLQDAAVQVYGLLKVQSQIIIKSARLAKAVNFNGKVYQPTATTEEVLELVRRGLPNKFVIYDID
jgi:hypothetical protein